MGPPLSSNRIPSEPTSITASIIKSPTVTGKAQILNRSVELHSQPPQDGIQSSSREAAKPDSLAHQFSNQLGREHADHSVESGKGGPPPDPCRTEATDFARQLIPPPRSRPNSTGTGRTTLCSGSVHPSNQVKQGDFAAPTLFLNRCWHRTSSRESPPYNRNRSNPNRQIHIRVPTWPFSGYITEPGGPPKPSNQSP